jgi:opacity protein-like surface antigen
LSYRYAELVFSSTDLDLLESDQSGIAAAVSWPLTERFYVRGSYARETVDTSLVIGLGSVAAERATDTISLTGGVRHGLTERVDLIGELLVGYSSLQLDIDTGGSGSTDQMLFGGRGGARWIFDRRMEFELDLRAVDTDDTEAEIGFGFGARFHATDNISLGLNYIGLDTADTIAGGIRFSW